MKTALDLHESDLDDDEQGFVSNIREYGWSSTRVVDTDGEEAEFTYSTGIYHKTGFPEIILFSVPFTLAHNILWDIYRECLAGKAPPQGVKLSGIFDDRTVVFLPVAQAAFEEHLGWSRWFYRGDDFQCTQLVWPNPEGKFPWEGGSNTKLAKCQPDLTANGWSGLIIE